MAWSVGGQVDISQEILILEDKVQQFEARTPRVVTVSYTCFITFWRYNDLKKPTYDCMLTIVVSRIRTGI